VVEHLLKLRRRDIKLVPCFFRQFFESVVVWIKPLARFQQAELHAAIKIVQFAFNGHAQDQEIILGIIGHVEFSLITAGHGLCPPDQLLECCHQQWETYVPDKAILSKLLPIDNTLVIS
jgi:hypothetical protein